MSDTFLTYNALDCACTYECRNGFWQEVRDGYSASYDLTVRLFDPLMFMQTRGLRVNQEALKHTRDDIAQAQKNLTEELHALVGRSINPLSPKEVAAYFYVEKGCQPYTNKEGQVTTDDGALQRLARPTARRAGFREAKLIQDIRGLNKLKSSYLDVNTDADGRLRCSWNPRGTKFGRLSSSETVFGTGLNLQNLHPQFKKFIWADQGYFFVEIDKRQAEWVIVAYLTGDANMLRVVQNGLDPHIYTAKLIFGLEDDTIKKDAKLVGHESDRNEILRLRQEIFPPELIEKMPTMMSCRQVGKHANHGLNYDEGYVTFALLWELEQSFSKWVVEKYHTVYPGIRLWYKAVQNQLAKDRTLVNCFGRRLRFLDQWGNDLFKAAYSALPQSTQVDGLNIGLCSIYEDPYICARDAINADLLAQVHDSILLQFPASVLQVEQDFRKVMAHVYELVSPEMEYHGRKFKIPTDMKVGLNWGAHHREQNQGGMIEVDLDSPNFLEKVREYVGSGAE